MLPPMCIDSSVNSIMPMTETYSSVSKLYLQSLLMMANYAGIHYQILMIQVTNSLQ